MCETSAQPHSLHVLPSTTPGPEGRAGGRISWGGPCRTGWLHAGAQAQPVPCLSPGRWLPWPQGRGAASCVESIPSSLSPPSMCV